MNRNHIYPITIDFLTVQGRPNPETWLFTIDPADLEPIRQMAVQAAHDAGAKTGKASLPITHDGLLIATAQSPLIQRNKAGKEVSALTPYGLDAKIQGLLQASPKSKAGDVNVTLSMVSVWEGKPAKNKGLFSFFEINPRKVIREVA